MEQLGISPLKIDVKAIKINPVSIEMIYKMLFMYFVECGDGLKHVLESHADHQEHGIDYQIYLNDLYYLHL
jgi:hypothetical protein